MGRGGFCQAMPLLPPACLLSRPSPPSRTPPHAPLTPFPSQGGGVFCNPTSPAAPAKLRCLYETFPLALVAEAAGGATHDGRGSGELQGKASAKRALAALPLHCPPLAGAP